MASGAVLSEPPQGEVIIEFSRVTMIPELHKVTERHVLVNAFVLTLQVVKIYLVRWIPILAESLP